MQVWQLNPRARLRRTPGGGAVFLPETATTVELDAEAFAALSLLGEPGNAHDLRRRLMADSARNITLAETDILLRELAAREVLIAGPAVNSRPAGPHPALRAPFSYAPESVHLQLNHTCNWRCPSCYVALGKAETGALGLQHILALIEEWACMGVFQLALGGGEPLMSSKFVPVVRSARRYGLVPNVTTNGWHLTETLLDEVQGSLGEVRLSLNDAVTVNPPLLESKVALLRTRGLRFGFNLIVTRRNLERLAELLSWARALGAATINLVRPKPAPGNQSWYRDNALANTDAGRLRLILEELEPLCRETTLSVDCAFSFLFQGQPAQELRARGVAGCAMGYRFASVQSNGDVYPCSHLDGQQFKAGNVTTESFCDIWERSEVFTRLRRELPRVGGSCAKCAHSPFCKGCRAVMWRQSLDWLAADTDCAAGASV